MEGRSPFRPAFGENKGPIRERECEKRSATGRLGSFGSPPQTAGDHQMDDGMQITGESQDDPFAEPRHIEKLASAEVLGGWSHSPKHEWVRDPDFLEHRATGAPPQSLDVERDVRELRHEGIVPVPMPVQASNILVAIAIDIYREDWEFR